MTPLFKTGDRSVISNYRPISSLSTYSKIFEKCMLNRLWDFLNKFKIVNTSQYGFLKGRSTEEAVTTLMEYFYENLNLGNYSVAVLIDFKKAFDTIEHSILLGKLEAYGVRGVALNWFMSYISDRKHFFKN